MSEKGTPTPKRIGLSRTSARGFKSPFRKDETSENPNLSSPSSSPSVSVNPASSSTPKPLGNIMTKRKFVSPAMAEGEKEIAKKQKGGMAEIEEDEKVSREIEEYLARGFRLADCDKHVELLHEYNDVKDAAQIIFGRIAEMEGVTVRKIHERYGLSETD